MTGAPNDVSPDNPTDELSRQDQSRNSVSFWSCRSGWSAPDSSCQSCHRSNVFRSQMEDTPQMILAKMIQRNPALQLLIDELDLALVE